MWFAKNNLVKPNMEDLLPKRLYRQVDNEADLTVDQDSKSQSKYLEFKEYCISQEDPELLSPQSLHQLKSLTGKNFKTKTSSVPYFKDQIHDLNAHSAHLRSTQVSFRSFGATHQSGFHKQDSHANTSQKNIKYEIPKGYNKKFKGRGRSSEYPIDKSNEQQQEQTKDTNIKSMSQQSKKTEITITNKRQRKNISSWRDLTPEASGQISGFDNKTNTFNNLEGVTKENTNSHFKKAQADSVQNALKGFQMSSCVNLMQLSQGLHAKKNSEPSICQTQRGQVVVVGEQKSTDGEALQKYINFIETLRERTLQKIISSEEQQKKKESKSKIKNIKMTEESFYNPTKRSSNFTSATATITATNTTASGENTINDNENSKRRKSDDYYKTSLVFNKYSKSDLSILQQLLTPKDTKPLSSSQSPNKKKDPIYILPSLGAGGAGQNELQCRQTSSQGTEMTPKMLALSFLTPKQSNKQPKYFSSTKACYSQQIQREKNQQQPQSKLTPRQRGDQKSEALDFESKPPLSAEKFKAEETENENGNTKKRAGVSKEEISPFPSMKSFAMFQDQTPTSSVSDINEFRKSRNSFGRVSFNNNMRDKKKMNQIKQKEIYLDEGTPRQRSIDIIEENFDEDEVIEDVQYDEQEEHRINSLLEQKKRILKQEKYEEMLEKISKMKETIRKSTEVRRAAEDLVDFLIVVFQKIEVTKKSLDNSFNRLIIKKPHFKYLLKSDYLVSYYQGEINQDKQINDIGQIDQLKQSQQIVTNKLLVKDILQAMSSFEFLLLNVDRDDIIKQVVIPDLFSLRDKINELLKQKTEIQLKNLQEGILREQNSINKINLHLFLSQKSVTSRYTNEDEFQQPQKLLSEITHSVEPLDQILSAERRLGSFSHVKNSGRMQSKQISDAIAQLKEKKGSFQLQMSQMHNKS